MAQKSKKLASGCSFGENKIGGALEFSKKKHFLFSFNTYTFINLIEER